MLYHIVYNRLYNMLDNMSYNMLYNTQKCYITVQTCSCQVNNTWLAWI